MAHAYSAGEREPLHQGARGAPKHGGFYDVEAGRGGYDDLYYQRVDENIRRDFIKKVYAIVATQLLLTAAAIGLVTLHVPAAIFVAAHHTAFWLSGLVLTLATLTTVTCAPWLTRKYPANFFWLLLFTAGETLTAVATVVALTGGWPNGPWLVLQAAAITAACVVTITLIAWYTSVDFTSWTMVVAVAMMAIAAGSVAALFFRGTAAGSVMNTVLTALAAVAVSMYILIDSQLLFGKHKSRFSEDEYIAASMALYIDIVVLFLHVLQLLSATSQRDRQGNSS